MAHEFTELAEEMSLTDGDGELCIVEEEGEHGHDDEGEEHEHEGEELGHDEGEEEHGVKFLKISSGFGTSCLVMHLSMYSPTYHSAGICGDRVGI